MAQEPTVRGVGVESSAPGRKVVQVRRGAFDVEREVFAVGDISVPARRLLRKRLGSELDAVRDLLRKSEFLSCGSGAAGAAAPAGKDGRSLVAEAAVEDDGSRAAKRRKVSPFVEKVAGEPKGKTPDDRERLAGRLASLAAVLPDHVVAFLQNQRVGDAGSRGDGDEIEMGVHSMKEGSLLHLKMLLDKFAPESTPKNHGRAALDASGVSRLSQHQDAGDKIAPVEEDENVVDICGGVSAIAIRDIAEEYGELVDDIGVQLLSPLRRKYIDLAEQDEYVDICGDASPVVFPPKADDTSNSPSSSSSDSDASSTSSDSDSSSASVSDSDESVSSPPPPPALPKDNDTYAQPREAAPEAVQTSEPEEFQDKRAAPVPTVQPVTSSPPAPAALPEENDTSTQPPEPAPKDVQIAEREKLQDQCAAAAATVYPDTSSAPPPAVLPTEDDASAQPAEPVLEAVQIAEPEELQDEGAAPAAAPPPITNLIALAQEALERRRQEEKERAKAKARQKLLEVERAALSDERVHPIDLELLGIAAFEHVVSSVEDARTARAPVNGSGLRVSPGCPSILQQLGLFLKADDGGGEEQQQQQPGFAPGGEDMEIEDGEIR